MAARAQVISPPTKRGDASYGLRAVAVGAQDVIQRIAAKLLQAGADANAADSAHKTPLHYAATGSLDKVKGP